MKLQRVLAVVVVATGAAAVPISACDQLWLPPVDDVPEFVEAVGVVESHLDDELDIEGIDRANGVVVRLVDSDGTDERGTRLEVFPLALGVDCAPLSRERRELTQQYPVGTRVSLGWHPSERSGTKVVLRSGSTGYLAAVPADVPRAESGCTDFERFRAASEPNGHPFSFEAGWRRAHRDWFETHELIRCYRLIDGMAEDGERLAALAGLAFYTGWRDAGNDEYAESTYREVLRRHDVGRRDRRRLMAGFRAERAGR